MAPRKWSIQNAKNRFSEVVEAARRVPQTVTKHGKPAVAIVDATEYQRLQCLDQDQAPSLAELCSRCRRMAANPRASKCVRAMPISNVPRRHGRLSELRKPQRDRGVIAWFERQRTADLFSSASSVW